MREYFVKWEGKSYWECSWVLETGLDVHQGNTLRPYMRKHNMETPPPLELPAHLERRRRRRSSHYDEKMEEKELVLLKAGVHPEWLIIQRVINSKTSKKFGTLYLVKWKDLPYDKATWEALDESSHIRGAAAAIKQYEEMNRAKYHQEAPVVTKKKKQKTPKQPKPVDPKKKYTVQPDYISQTGGTLHPYQLEGINWIRFSWAQNTNTILADEMGLGKTIQTISFLYSLVKEGHTNGPFLISAPLSTIINWEREFEFWAPDLYVVTYHGSKDNRAIIREHEFSFVSGAVKGTSKQLQRVKKDLPIKFNVLLTSYEYVSVDATVLQSINWAVLVVDEAHRLKNNQSKFFRVLSQYKIKYKLLLTGTPLQNNLEELFHLLNFLSRDNFNSLEEFQEEFADISKEDQVSKLHDMLAPHLLRRLKADVLKNIPSKTELIVRVDLAPMQKKFYRWILTKNFEKLNTKGAKPVSLINIMMDLKKCSNHPYLFPTAAEEAPLTAGGYYEGTALIASSGKLIVLEKMLKKLKESGHRVLIFSQMTKMLDILEDFLEHLSYKYERIDGGVTGSERQQCIDRFNAPGAEQFVFLLSTRAGGLGINLASADTVIIFDSDWNPHNDVQAFSRAHRIGQANKVMIYRFVTRNSVEERVCEVAKRKMMLTHLVVRGGLGSTTNQPSLSKRELDDILKFGTQDLFKGKPRPFWLVKPRPFLIDQGQDGEESMGIVYDDKAVEALLDRSQGSGEDGPDENLLANEYLSQFKVASYVMKEKGEEPEAEPEIIQTEEPETPNDADFWEKLLRHHYEQQKEIEAAKLGKGKRVRKQINYMDTMSTDLSELKGEEGDDESIYEESDDAMTDEESDDEVDFSTVSRRKARTAFKSKSEVVPPLLAKMNNTIHVYGFNPRQRKAFLNSILRYGMPPDNALSSSWLPKELRNKNEATFNAYVSMFMRHLCEPDTPNSVTHTDGVPKMSVPRQNILTRIGVMKLIKNKIDQYNELNGNSSMPGELAPPPPPPLSSATVTLEPSSDREGELKTAGSEENTSVNKDKDAPPTAPPKTDPPLVTDKVESSTADVSVTKPSSSPLKSKLMFNIADGGFTELHSLWSVEKTQGYDPTKWGRHHDYWLLKGIVKHGYCRWSEICADPHLSILNKPFTPEENASDAKNRFLLRRFKLLEQALAIEEQLHRASSAGLVQDPNKSVMLLHSRFTDLDCLADGHQSLVKDCLNGSKYNVLLMRKALGKMEEILLEMKQDISKLSMELTKCSSVSQQLKIDELSILSKLAGREKFNGTAGINKTPDISSTTHQSVITSAPQNGSSSKIKSVPKTIPAEVPPAPVQLQPEAVTIPKVATPGGTGQTFTVPHFVEGATVLVPTQTVGGVSQTAVPVVSGQQVVYWAPRVNQPVAMVTSQTPTILTPVGGGVQYTVSRAPPTAGGNSVSALKKKL
ncbi:PREDICTED: chromodomain-helicase-DNA-binding protein 5-like isoform X1 [Amphimedon queenslandica]|uniref:DNA helicase n=1 Tax=Amphimedon queenslandica TaxID=400682 RepID=A0AAN0JFQ7_AMPQE|nr:PREDICTED: chromodomain-helicase-DNA-binding protein 5-like isoform X1 [Amphimedon queenslandica]|eukprot:XP_019855875.1 PREDICTED: chromodomain-helicase-DNA-binding protein 5-like isoform X1 [Amphimedon queenslandica]